MTAADPPTTGSGPLIALTDGGPEPVATLVAVPHAGGTASAFRPWAAPLAARRVALMGVDWSCLPTTPHRAAPPGAGIGPASDESGVHRRAAGLADALTSLDAPVLLLGHSFGGLIAYETARVMESRGDPRHRLGRLFLCAVVPPHLREPDVVLEESDSELTARLRRLGGADQRALAHPRLAALLLARLRADALVARGYRHRHDGRLRCPTTVCAGVDDPVAPGAGLGAWTDLLTGPRLRSLPGGHFFPFLPDDRAPGFLETVLMDAGLSRSPEPPDSDPDSASRPRR